MCKLDSITAAVIQNNLRSAAREMQGTLLRCGPHPVIYEMLDFGVEILDADFGTIGQAPGMVIFMGSLSLATRTCVDMIGKENLEPGDVVITAGHVTTGAHTPDAVIFTPIFYKRRLFGYASTKAHWIDVGAKDPMATIDTTETFGEGIRVPPVKLYKNGVLDPEIKEFMQWNSRAPDMLWEELQAQIACCHTAESRVTILLDKYGWELVSAAIQDMYDHDEKLARDAIEKMPNGVWSDEAYIDDNGVDLDKPVKIKVTVTIHGSDMTIDFTGSAEEQRGSVNCPIISTISTGRLVVKALTSPTLPASEGSFRPVKVIAPEGSMFYPGPLAATSCYGIGIFTAMELINKALHLAIPERAPACSAMSPCSTGFSGIDRKTGKFFLTGQPYGVGMGASFSSDGESAIQLLSSSGGKIIPIEVEESEYPQLIERFELDQDSGGPGKHRGGLGIKRDCKLLQPVTFMNWMDGEKFPHWGLEGGKPGRRNFIRLQTKAKGEFEVPKVAGLALDEGDKWLHRPGGGGGYGNPLERDLEAVRQDVINEYVSVESARRDYGVIIDPDTFDIDIEATKKSRKIGK